jgi:hypothetical protein
MTKTKTSAPKTIALIASGDLRTSANEVCWAAQLEMEKELAKAVKSCGFQLKRAHQPKRGSKHGFIDSQKKGMEVFANIDPEMPIIVAEAVWQYSHHVLPGLLTHRGPYSYCRQLVRPMARTRRHAKPQRLPHKSRC